MRPEKKLTGASFAETAVVEHSPAACEFGGFSAGVGHGARPLAGNPQKSDRHAPLRYAFVGVAPSEVMVATARRGGAG
jgi:hypothetical protein